MTTSAESKWSGIFEKFYFLTPPSVSLRSPPTPQVGVGKKHGGEGRLTQNLASPCLQGEGDRVSTSNLASPPLAGGRGTTSLPQILPTPACGGRGTTKWWKGVAPSGRCQRSGHKNSVKGKGAIKHKGAPTIIYHCTDAPFRLAPLATHPLSGGGQEKHGGEGRLTQNLASPCLQGEGDHQVVEGVAVGHYDKNQETFISFLFSDIIELTFSYKF